MILFITNKAGFDNKTKNCDHDKTFIEYKLVLMTLIEFAKIHNYRIVTKMKSTGLLETKSQKVNHSNISTGLRVVSGLELPYDLMIEADIIIIQGYSTTYIESLYLGKWVILIQIPFNSDFLGVHQFPNLLKCYTTDSLNIELKKIHESIEKHGLLNSKKQSDTQMIFKDADAYLHHYLNSPRELTYNRLLTEAKKDFN